MEKEQNMITAFNNKQPHIGPGVFVDLSARLIGEIEIRKDASIWPMAVLRADSNRILIGKRSAVLDKVLIEAPQDHPVMVEGNAIISHGAILHGCQVDSKTLVGIGAIVLDGAAIGSGSIIGAGSIITPGTVVPQNSLVLGVPGKVVRQTTADERNLIECQLDELYKKSREYLRLN